MKPAHSPLFEPVLWEGDGFRILDETLLPDRVQYIVVREISQALQAVRDMKTRAFGQVLTFLYSAALTAHPYNSNETEPLKRQLDRMTAEFCAARPTFDFKGIAGPFAAWFRELPGGAPAGPWIETQARQMAAAIIRAREERAKRTAELLPASCRLLTHCNISGELAAVARWCVETGKKFSVIATETRPYLQGSRLTAWEVAQVGVPVSIIPDCAVAQVMDKGEVDAVLVGSDRCAQNGDIINKVGTYPLALMAKEYGIPFYALVQDPGALACGDDLQIEERPIAELFTFQGRSLVPEGAEKLAGRYPAFDVTPSSLVTSLIGFDDCFTAESFRKKYQSASLKSRNGKNEKEKYLLVFGMPRNDSYAYLARALRAERAQSVLVPEMRPELWGIHVVARELLARHTPVTLISDNMMGTLFAQGQIRRLVLFYGGLEEKGPSGICGSLLAVSLARAHRVPIELLESEAAREAPGDRDISTFLGQRVSPEGVSVHPIGTETVPWSLFNEHQGAGS